MRIIIAGAGKLGFSIAQLLAEDQFDVVVVEVDPKRKEVVQNSLDVLAIEGNSCSPTTFADPDVCDADVLIACTDSDEVNMVTCLMAKNHGIKHTVARIRNVEYAVHAPEMLNKDMKIDLVINPERITAVEIDHILMTPSALNVDEFAEGKVRMFEAKVREDSPLINIPLKNLNIPKNILMAMVFRRHRMIIPRGNDYVIPGDNVYFVGKHDAIRDFENSFSNTYEKLERVLIIGAGRTGRFLAPMLENQGIQVKVIEKNKDRCQMLASKLNRGLVLCGDGTDIDLLMEEGVSEADVVICLTEDDKLNLLLAQLAKHLGARKTIVRVARNEYIELMENLSDKFVETDNMELLYNDTTRTLRENVTNIYIDARMEEFMFLGLRMTCGVSREDFKERFNKDIYEVYGSVLNKYIGEGFMASEGDRIYLTDAGIDVSNVILADFLL